MAEFIADAAADVVRVRSPHARELAALLSGEAVVVRVPSDQTLEVEGMSSDQIGTVAAGAGLTLFELTTQGASLEEAYMALTADSLDYRSSDARVEESAA